MLPTPLSQKLKGGMQMTKIWEPVNPSICYEGICIREQSTPLGAQ